MTSSRMIPPLTAIAADVPCFPRMRWLALAWLAVYVPAYAWAYPLWNFLFLCNLGVLLTALGFWLGNRLLLSSQAVASPVIGLAWSLDVAWKLSTGDFLFGGTAYMWDPQYPLFTRLISLYHVFWPLIVLATIRRIGYDRRGWLLQSAIAATGLVVARLATPAVENVNFAFRDPFWGLQLGPPLLHLAVVAALLAGVVYGITHRLLARAYG
jgi:hypothetical protein